MACFLCGKNGSMDKLERHHIFFGTSNRKHSEAYGLVVDLCGEECHKRGKNAVHNNPENDLKLKKYGQKKFMLENDASVDDFRKLFLKNYLDEDEIENLSFEDIGYINLNEVDYA